MSVPQSPIPAQRKSPAPTVVEPAARGGAAAQKKPASPRPAAPEKKSSAAAIAATLLLLLAGGGGAGWYFMMGPGATPKTQPLASQSGSPVTTPAVPAPNADSIRQAQLAAADSVRKLVQDSLRADSITKVAEAAAAAKRLAASTKTPGGKTAGSKTSSTKTQTPTQTATQETKTQPPPQTEAPKPVPVADGTIVIGTRTPGATLFINGVPRPGALGSIDSTTVKPGDNIKVSIRAEKCTPFETTVSVPAGGRVTIGRKNLECTP